jgi:GNAT superfamily N-acetyltransferase
MSLTIRPATPDDADALTDLFDDYLAFYGRTPAAGGSRPFLAARLQAGDARVLLAEDGGRAIGFALMYPSWSSLAQAPIFLLSDLFVDPRARQQGAGRALLEACEASGREAGMQRLQLETQRTNTVAQALYTELGWESDDEFVVYQLPLTEPPR